jgi:hypothetical protein
MRSDPPTGDELAKLLVTMKRNVLEQVAHEPAPATPAKRGRSANRGLIFGIGLTALLGVGAGAAFAFGVVTSNQASEPAPQQLAPIASPSPEPTPTATPTPTPEFEVAPPAQPISRYGLDCDTLVDPALVQALFSTPVQSADPIATASGLGSISIPRRTSIMSVGGTVCEWSNGVATNTERGSDPNYVGVTISVTPRPAAGWSARAAYYLAPENFWAICPAETWNCSASTQINDAWVTLEASSDTDIDQVRWQTLLDAVIEKVESAGPAAPPSTVERLEFYFTADQCEAILPLESIRSITSLPGTVFGSDGGGGWSDWGEAMYTAGNGRCGWDVEARSAANVNWVRDGRWAFIRMRDGGAVTPVHVAGSSEAFARCSEGSAPQVCAVDLMVGDDWYNVRAADADVAAALAEEILQRSAE